MPEETERTIRIPVVALPEGHKVRTITISSSQGIKALYDVTDKKIVTFLFDKSKGWTMASAKKWVKEHRKSKSKKDLIAEDLPGFIHPQYGKPPKKRRRKRKKRKKRNSKSLPALFLNKKAITQILRRKKKAIVRGAEHQKIIDKDIYICGDSVYGIINLNKPLEVDFDQFKNLKSRHLISDDEGEKLFAERKHLYIYNFKIKKIFKTPRKYKKTEEKEFIESLTILENLRMYKFKEEDINSELLEKADYDELIQYQYILGGLYKRAKRRGETKLKALVYSNIAITLKLLLLKIQMCRQKNEG